MAQLDFKILIHCIVIYRVDSAIHFKFIYYLDLAKLYT